MSDDYGIGDLLTAIFDPKRTDNLRACMTPLIGEAFEWEYVGTGGDDEAYPGQSRWSITRKSEAEIPDACKGLWTPLEDLRVLERKPRWPE